MTSLTEVEKMTAGVRRCGVIVDVRACVRVNIAGEYACVYVCICVNA